MDTSETTQINDEKMDTARAPTADKGSSCSKAKQRRKRREGWTNEMILRRKATQEKLLKKRHKLRVRIEYKDPALELH